MDRARRMMIGGMAAAWFVPRAAWGGVEERVRRIVISVDRDPANDFAFVPGLIASELARHGFADNRDFVLVKVPLSERAEGASLASWQYDARALLEARPDVILATGTEFTRILASLAPATPIVFFMVGDPVLSGLVSSMKRPGSNVTGVSNRLMELVGKRLELLKELTPNLRRVALLMHGAIDGPITRREFFAAARKLGVEGVEVTIPPGAGPDALTRLCLAAKADGVFDGRAVVEPGIDDTAKSLRRCGIPAIYTRHEIVEKGGLISLGARFDDQVKSAVAIAARILRGASPATIPIDQLSKVHLALNLATARAMDIAVPESILVRADQVIR